MSRGKKGQGGASMSGLEVSPERQKRERKRRQRQEKKWAAKSGPVKVYFDRSCAEPKQSDPG